MKRLLITASLVALLVSLGCSTSEKKPQVNNTTNVSQTPSLSQPNAKEKPTIPTSPIPTSSIPASPVNFSYPFPSSGVPILMYHTISDLPGNNLGVPPTKFAEQMQFLHDAGFTTVSPDDLFNAYQGSGKLPKKPVLLTFDDGYPDNYSVAFPILKKFGFVATFFVITGDVDHGMMTWNQLKEMQDYGMFIESHTVSHPDLRNLSGAALHKQLADSKVLIETKLNTSVKFFCYPSGKYNDQTLQQLKETGYTMGVTTAYGDALPGQNPLLFSRIRINGSSNLETFKKQVSEPVKLKKNSKQVN